MIIKNNTETLYLVKPDLTHKKEYFAMMDEWTKFGGRLNPGALRNKGNKYRKWLSWIKEDSIDTKKSESKVPQTLYFLKAKDHDKILGAISIRHRLNEELMFTGGNIGYGIRPSERRQNYATKMLSMGLNECKKLKLERVLITCDKDNIASAKVIINNGGTLENEVINENGVAEQRYWINLIESV